MTIVRWTLLPMLGLLVAGCIDIPDPAPPASTPDGESMPPADEGGGGGTGGGSGAPTPAPGPAPMMGLSCEVAGQTFAEGSAVPSDDRCNSCICYYGSVVCTANECSPAPEPEPEPVLCETGGESFPDGAEVPSGDDCNTCSCEAGSVVCTELACDPVFCAEFVEDPDGVCSRFPLDPCIAQDPDCASEPAPEGPVEPAEPIEP